MSDPKPEFVAVGTLSTKSGKLAAHDHIDEIAKLLDRFEDIRVESDGYDENGHRIWEVSVPR